MHENSKVLITGGSGFIGTNLIDHLINQNCKVLNIDISLPNKEEHKHFWKEVDICDYKKFEEAILGFDPDYVIHLAARTDLNGKTLSDYAANIVGVENLLKILDKLPNIQRVLFTSSMYVCEPGYKPNGFDDYYPHTEYGKSKVETERIIKTFDPQYTWSIIRPTSIWGPYFGEPYNLFFKIVLSRKYFHMGKRACRKTYGYIDNTIYQIISIMQANKDDISRKIFYLGDYEPYDITEWADEIAKVAGFKIPNIPFFLFRMGGWFGDFLKLLRVKFPMTSFRLKNMTTDNIHDLSLIKAIAPDMPTKRIDGVRKTINWLKNN